MAPPSTRDIIRYKEVRRADALDDQKSALQILAAELQAKTQEQLQEYVLSQVKRIIHGNNAGYWRDDFVTSGIKSLQDLTDDIASITTTLANRKVGIPLAGATNGINRTFTTPQKFVHVVGGDTIEVFHGGVRLRQASGPSPLLGDYWVSESGGLGTGFDTVNLLTFTPVATSNLCANYVAA